MQYHEGDWEHINVKLDRKDNASEIEYHIHNTSCFDYLYEAPLSQGTYHPLVEVAKGSHADYPAGGVGPSGHKYLINADRFTLSDKSLQWYPTNLKNLTKMDFYAYTGGWGEVHNNYLTTFPLSHFTHLTPSDYTGPEGPDEYKSGTPSFSSKECKDVPKTGGGLSFDPGWPGN